MCVCVCVPSIDLHRMSISLCHTLLLCATIDHTSSARLYIACRLRVAVGADTSTQTLTDLITTLHCAPCTRKLTHKLHYYHTQPPTARRNGDIYARRSSARVATHLLRSRLRVQSVIDFQPDCARARISKLSAGQSRVHYIMSFARVRAGKESGVLLAHYSAMCVARLLQKSCTT